ncbi:hypothetical protein K432DRAFT_404318 [Lepidopterella palustris CBS 459.81]|uniref:Uncharacterized protein n=1 Tax=Lepidopterella palustris CBS 459.81 TaxID=1314670 RepID=A0A8E2EBR2_9PEZI|nr:hypothetical protein K432DRAFT_404318 [Lepidopterella palustris CBS 459.81]
MARPGLTADFPFRSNSIDHLQGLGYPSTLAYVLGIPSSGNAEPRRTDEVRKERHDVEVLVSAQNSHAIAASRRDCATNTKLGIFTINDVSKLIQEGEPSTNPSAIPQQSLSNPSAIPQQSLSNPSAIPQDFSHLSLCRLTPPKTRSCATNMTADSSLLEPYMTCHSADHIPNP